jgi:capsid assembly protease
LNYTRVITEFRNRCWAVSTDTFGSMLELMARWGRGEKFSQDEVEVRIREANARNGMSHGSADLYREAVMISGASRRNGTGANSSGGAVALIPVIGFISHRASMLTDISSGGGTSVEKLTAQFRQAISDPNVKAIVLDVDSPGGGVEGVFELAQEIFQARGRKKIVAVANSYAASAAYAIAAAASELVVAQSGQVGSIGVYASHEDHSKELERQGVKITVVSAGKYKTEGSSIEPLSDAARAELQGKVDEFYQMFLKAVAICRNDSPANVRSGYGQGRCAIGASAVRANLADRVGTLDDVLARLGVARPGMGMAAGMPRDISVSGAEEPDSIVALHRRKLELDLISMGTAAGNRAEAPESLTAQQRRLQLEIDLMRL